MEERARQDWAVSLERALDDAGVDRDDFAEAAALALQETAHQLRPRDPKSMLTASEAALLREGGLTLEPRRPGETDIVMKTAADYALMLVEAKSTSQVAADLRVTPARVRQRVLERTLYAIRSRDEWRFPSWQFDESGELLGLAMVLPAIPADLHPVAVFRFLTEPSPDLELADEPVAPLLWLRTGGSPDRVASLAAAL
jgi:hypothetical protein